MRTLAIEIELEPATPDAGAVPQRVAGNLRQALGLTVPVQVVAAGSLPRYELKSKRFIVAE
jgi:phenylacetate-coenzyme A ligase PaaK-like adenylate-forming protein